LLSPLFDQYWLQVVLFYVKISKRIDRDTGQKEELFMADYQKLYALLCGVIDDVIDPLERIPLALQKNSAVHLCRRRNSILILRHIPRRSRKT
jgi:hypothetical protein